MRVSQKCQYAIRAVLELAKRYGHGPVTIGDIARKQAVPPRFLEIILNGMTLMNVDEYWQYVARAVLILGSVLIYQSQEMRTRD